MKAYLIRGGFYVLLLLAVCVIPFALAKRPTAKGNRSANTITVTNTNDSGPGSLRQALADANDGDTINFAVTGTIALTSGELLVTRSIMISGPGAENLAVNGNGKNRVFHVNGGNVTISDLTITNGSASRIQCGGGIYNDHSTLTVNNSTITGNSASQGGGICNDGSANGAATLQINNSNFSGNSGGQGAAILNYAPYVGYAAVQINSSSMTGNAGYGISIIVCLENVCGQASVQVDSCTLSANNGGIFADVRSGLAVSNSTLSGNGVALTNYDNVSTTSISNCTLNESSVNTGDIFNYTGVLTIDNTVLKAGPSGHSIVNFGTVTSLGYNLSNDDAGGYLIGPGDQINTDPMLGPLQDNGGATFTHALLPGSPAIDSGDPKFTPPPFYDQRGPGFDRVRGGRIDIGAFEVQETTPTPTPTSTPRVTPTPRSAPTPRLRPTSAPRSTRR